MSLPDYIPVRQVMRKEVTFVNGRTNVFEALRIMRKVQATCLIVEKRHENDEYGMLLFSDVAKRVIARDRAPERVNVYEIMAKPVIAIRPNMDIRYCARLFDNFGISHAPVIENDEVVGIVSYYLLVLEGLPNLD
jgi:predicted transcriptional regulator